MSRKLKSLSTLLAFAILLVAASTAMSQDARARTPVLGCCKYLEGTTTLDLSTISSNNWTVTNNGANPAVFLTQVNSAWNINPGPAKWVSTTAGGGNGTAGNFDYSLNFVVNPDCKIRPRITLSGNYGGDNNVAIYLDSISGPNLIAQCTGNYCFTSSHQPLPTFTKAVGPGPHTLIVRVNNIGGPAGMFINARLTSDCAN